MSESCRIQTGDAAVEETSPFVKEKQTLRNLGGNLGTGGPKLQDEIC